MIKRLHWIFSISPTSCNHTRRDRAIRLALDSVYRGIPSKTDNDRPPPITGVLFAGEIRIWHITMTSKKKWSVGIYEMRNDEYLAVQNQNSRDDATADE